MRIRTPLLASAWLASSLALSSAAADQVYKWVDKDGKVHFSQTPPPSTAVKPEKVNVQSAQGFSMPAPASIPVQSPAQDPRARQSAEDKAKAYDADVQIRGQECADLQRQLDALADDMSLTATERAGKERVVLEQMKDACR